MGELLKVGLVLELTPSASVSLESQVAQAGLNLTLELRMTLTFWCFSSQFLSRGAGDQTQLHAC